MDEAAIITKLKKAPKTVLDAARNDSISALMELAMYWHRVPELLDMGVLEVYYGRLDASEAPDSEASESLASTRAFASLLGFTNLGILGNDKAGRQAAERLLQAWPGIFKWAFYFFTSRVKSTAQPPQIRRNAVRLAALETPGAVEMATFIWFFEDSIPAPSMLKFPICTMALDSLLRMGDVGNLNRVMAASGGNADGIAKLVMKRIKIEMRKPAIETMHATPSIHLLGKFSHPPQHLLRYAFVAHGAVGTMTHLLLACITQMATSQTECHHQVIMGCFVYIRNAPQSNCTDGFKWVLEAVKAGLLLAFVNASPHYSMMPPRHQEYILEIIELIVPRYLVYRTVINNVHAALAIAQASPYIASVFQSPAKGVWEAFVRVAKDRKAFERQSVVPQGQFLVCDNSKCLKTALRAQFRKCSACGHMNYCSKECQTMAWKEGDHKTVCKLKQRERIDHRSISNTDALFIYKLSFCDAVQNLAHIKTKAACTYPGMPLYELVVNIDYMCHPERYAVSPLAGYRPGGTQEPRQAALLDMVREDPRQWMVVEAMVAHGGGGRRLMSARANVWELPPDTLGELYDEGGLSAEVD
ncbi:hypothetical protein FIBSPDRAFT_954168 [Athelia psychrophila]|uniref:MYND-type domain-containing protein n=1 Tax=Athelia psychrophila TaxID=1759441 RepID=A0A166JLD3_9AGAM|nr:hypothetical protein FIBSPDRAFT_954168 [Fibularhizoctonia sp. CBS 109695]